MKPINNNRKLVSLEEMFAISSGEDSTTPEETAEVKKAINTLPLDQLHTKRNHRFRTELGKKNEDLLQSIRDFGVLEPIIVQPIDDGYEILSGHRRTELARRAGLTEIPAVIKEGLSPEEADLVETETNLYQRGWQDMCISERAAVLFAHYNAVGKKGIRTGFMEQINEEIKTLKNPVKSTADEGLSPVATKGNIRDIGEQYELSKDTIARYLRIHTLIEELKDRMDLDEIAFRAGVQLSYITQENQQYLDVLLDTGYRVDIKKAEQLRELEEKGQLNEARMQEVLSGIKQKKPGRPKAFKIQESIISKYFEAGTKQKEIEAVIDAALEAYFKDK